MFSSYWRELRSFASMNTTSIPRLPIRLHAQAHYSGVCRYDGESFVNVSEKEGLRGTEVWDLYQDRAGNIWFPVEHAGLFRYDGHSFTNFSREQGLESPAIQSTLEDREGRFWAGGYLGLYRFEDDSFVSISRNGPW